MPRNTADKNKSLIIPIFLLAISFITTTWANHHAYCQGMDEYDPNLDNPDTTFFIPSISNFCFASFLDMVSDIITIFLVFLMSALLQKKYLTDNTNENSLIFYIERISIALILITTGISTEAVFKYLGSISDREDMNALNPNHLINCHEISPAILPTLTNTFLLSSVAFFLASPFTQTTDEARLDNEETNLGLNV